MTARSHRRLAASVFVSLLIGLGAPGIVVSESPAPIAGGAVANRAPTRLAELSVVTGDGFGDVALGQPLTDVRDEVERRLGPVVELTVRQLQPPVETSCVGASRGALASWDGLTLFFVGDSDTRTEDFELFSFSIGQDASANGFLGFESSNGANAGDSVVEWQRLHPTAQLFPGDAPFLQAVLELDDGLFAEIDLATDTVRELASHPPWFCQ